jgi:hypothetical protein
LRGVAKRAGCPRAPHWAWVAVKEIWVAAVE